MGSLLLTVASAKISIPHMRHVLTFQKPIEIRYRRLTNNLKFKKNIRTRRTTERTLVLCNAHAISRLRSSRSSRLSSDRIGQDLVGSRAGRAVGPETTPHWVHLLCRRGAYAGRDVCTAEAALASGLP